MQSLVDCVLFDAQDLGDLISGEAIPRRETKQLLVGRAQFSECSIEGLELRLWRNRLVARPRQASSESSAATARPVLVADDAICDGKKPASSVVQRSLLEASPYDDEDLGGGILRIGRTQTSQAIAKNRVVIGSKERVELHHRLPVNDIASCQICLSVNAMCPATVAYLPAGRGQIGLKACSSVFAPKCG